MKHLLSYKNIFFTLISAVLSLTLPGRATASDLFPFKSHSILASGKWVKVEIEETGIYEIPYKDLRDMGFTDPSRVGVWGKGGAALPYTFIEDNNPVMIDDLSPVSVWHNNDRLYFYGRGCENITFNVSSKIFEKKSLNIYSNIGAYFLSETDNPSLISEYSIPTNAAAIHKSGYDYIYREDDLYQNSTQTGNIFWGENLIGVKDGYHWKYSLPLLDINLPVRLDVKVFAADKSSGILHYGLLGAESGNQSFQIQHPKPYSGTKVNPEFATMNTKVASVSIKGNEADVFVRAENASASYLNLDYWILSYTKIIPDFSLTQHPQERLTLTPKATSPGKIQIAAENIAIFDITNPDAVSLLAKKETSSGAEYFFPAGDNVKNLIICDLSREQKKIKKFENLSNSDLHGDIANGADLLIITVPRYKDFAESLADLHRRHQNISVIVASTPDVYNEFSGGIPDPMAYRAMMKMCYENSGKTMKNLLLVGPVAGNFRSMASGDKSTNFIIGFQDLKVTTETHAANAMDFYGFANNTTYSALQNNKMHVGVGILPFMTDGEAATYLSKVEHYLTDADKAAIVNEYMSMGGVGDNHTHDLQAVQLAEYRSKYYPVKHPDCIVAHDAYGSQESKAKIIKEWRYGKLFSSFFGHGSAQGINMNFKTSDIPLIKNQQPGFMLFCACDISGTDFLKKGLGELLVTGTHGGMMATIFASRTAWSGQNYELAKHISSWMYLSPENYSDPSDASIQRSIYRETSPTIGEIVALSKSSSNYSNSTSYLLVGDPALTVPVPLRRILATARKKGTAGTNLTIKGFVTERDSIHLRDTLPIDHFVLPTDRRYNGKIVAKIHAPEETRLSADYVSNTSATGKKLYIPYNDTRIAEYCSTVKNGEYSFDITLPDELSAYEGEDIQIFLSSYDHERDLAASGYITLRITDSSDDPTLADVDAPSVNTDYDDSNRMMSISVYDQGGLDSGCLTAILDGHPADLILPAKEKMGTEIRFCLFTDRLAHGEHSLKLSAEDMAGNKTERMVSFNVERLTPSLILSCDHQAVTGEIEFKIDPPVDYKTNLFIYDDLGYIVFSSPFEGDSLYWDTVLSYNTNGTKERKATKGLYRAVAKSADGKENKFSNIIYFAIIE